MQNKLVLALETATLIASKLTGFYKVAKVLYDEGKVVFTKEDKPFDPGAALAAIQAAETTAGNTGDAAEDRIENRASADGLEPVID